MNISTVKHCVGCMACADRCPKSCIHSYEDTLGHRYPNVNATQCIDCGACLKVCPAENPPLLHEPLKVVAAWRTDEKLREQSSSGGIASALAEEMIAHGGSVYGCAFVPPFSFRHIRCTTKEELHSLRGSKYVQSAINDIYRQIKVDLKNGLEVLFIGTPCQVAGLLGFLGYKTYENLYTVDLVCHGVPSQQMLNDNIDLYTKAKGEECRVHFREKLRESSRAKRNAIYRITFGWFFQNQPYVSEPIFLPYQKDPYMLGFISGLTFRPNCYECRYASVARVADLTLSDYWGLSKNAGFDKGKGVSNILVNTGQGRLLWNLIKNESIYQERPLLESVWGNGQLKAPSVRHPEHERFVLLYSNLGFKTAVEECSRRYLKKMKQKKVLETIKNTIRLFFR